MKYTPIMRGETRLIHVAIIFTKIRGLRIGSTRG
jgi:predicted N-formylglutamate amidohydrolase